MTTIADPGAAPPAGPTPQRVFRDHLIAPTIANALAVPFYRRHWSGVAADSVRHVGDLMLLPTVDKRTLMSAEPRSLRRPGLEPAVVTHTTGTTGTPFVRARSSAELAAFSDHVDALREAAAECAGETPRPVATFSAVPATVHGAFAATSVSQLRLSVDVFSSAGMDKTIALLTRDDIVPDGFERRLVGSPGGLLLLSHELAARGIDTGNLGLTGVVSLTDLLLPGQQQVLRSAWPGATLVNRYSLSEAGCGATQCQDCGLFHFDPSALPEVLDLDSGAPVNRGLGELTATELYPFAQLQPMVRYRTGDVVEAVESACEPGEISVRLVGRRAHTPLLAVDGRTVAVVSPVALACALEEDPRIARRSLGAEGSPGSRLQRGRPLGRVTAQQEGRDCHVDLHVTPAFDPGLYPRQAQELVEDLTRLLCDTLVDGRLDRTALQVHVRLRARQDLRGEEYR